jgi:hypothetical protein
MKTSPATLTLLAALLLATAACAPKVDTASRLSTINTTCAFTPDACADLHSVDASVR